MSPSAAAVAAVIEVGANVLTASSQQSEAAPTRPVDIS
eukprot:SAG11_NODE_30407_length_301_cov_0.772277_2_plen_37_part_01